MRRLIAYITVAFTLLVFCLIGVPTIKDKMSNGTDFNGGYNIVYHVTDIDENNYSETMRKSVMDKAAKYTNDRLNTLNITNPDVAIANENYLSITVQDLPESQLDVVRYAIANSAEITLRDIDGCLLCEGSEVFSELSLSVSQGTVYLSCKVKDSAKLESITSSLAAESTGDGQNNGSFPFSTALRRCSQSVSFAFLRSIP